MVFRGLLLKVLIRLLKARLKVLLKVLIRLLKAPLKVLLKVLIRLLKARLKVLLKVLIRLLKARLKVLLKVLICSFMRSDCWARAGGNRRRREATKKRCHVTGGDVLAEPSKNPYQLTLVSNTKNLRNLGQPGRTRHPYRFLS